MGAAGSCCRSVLQAWYSVSHSKNVHQPWPLALFPHIRYVRRPSLGMAETSSSANTFSGPARRCPQGMAMGMARLVVGKNSVTATAYDRATNRWSVTDCGNGVMSTLSGRELSLIHI